MSTNDCQSTQLQQLLWSLAETRRRPAGEFTLTSVTGHDREPAHSPANAPPSPVEDGRQPTGFVTDWQVVGMESR